MGEFIGIGTTHSPPLMMPDKGRQSMFEESLKAPNVDPRFRDMKNWPADMVTEMCSDRGVSASTRHRERLIACFNQQRKILDDYKPDFIIIFGDDHLRRFVSRDRCRSLCDLGSRINETTGWWGTYDIWSGFGGNRLIQNITHEGANTIAG